MTLIKKLMATDGWMNTNGDFYPCILHRHYDDINFGGNFHFAGAKAIVAELYPELKPPYGVWGQMQIQMELINRGWIRVDIENLWFDDIQKITPEQIAALKAMLEMPDDFDGFCREDTKQTLKDIENPPDYTLVEPD